MSGYVRIMAALCAGVVGWSIGRGLGLPEWTQLEAGDRWDLAVSSGFLVWLLSYRKGDQ